MAEKVSLAKVARKRTRASSSLIILVYPALEHSSFGLAVESFGSKAEAGGASLEVDEAAICYINLLIIRK